MIHPTFIDSLAGTPAVYYGFWYSNFISRGPMLTLNTFWATVFTLAFSSLITWSLSRLWKIVCAIIFFTVYNAQPTWEESQNTALIVNNKTVLGGFFDATGLFTSRRKLPGVTKRAKSTLTTMAVAALLIFGLILSYPFLVALIPVTNFGLIVSKRCGVLPAGQDVIDSWSFLWGAKLARSANAAFLVLDGKEMEDSNSISKPFSDLPEVSTSYVDKCPDNVPACSLDSPFTFTSDYTLSSQHFALNFDMSFSLRVSQQCYRPIQATRTLDEGSDYTSLGFFYGPRNTTTQVLDYTERTYIERRLSPGYTLAQVDAIANSRNIWTPNSTLLQGGDTTILFYYVGGVGMTEPSADPIFATQNTPIGPNAYRSLYVAAPIVCDTKYVLCAGDGRDCSDSGGKTKVISWLNEKEDDTWNQLRLFFGTTLDSSPLYQASLGSNAVAAAQTALNGVLQLNPANATAQRELSRLVTAGMLLLAGNSQLSAMGYWDVGNGTTGLFQDDYGSCSLCNNVIVESPSVSTIAVIPYSILLIISVHFVLLSYAYHLPFDKFLGWDDHRGAWALYSAGQLHREVMERIRGRFQMVDTSTAWPTAITQHEGPVVMAWQKPPHGGKHFGSGIAKACFPKPIQSILG